MVVQMAETSRRRRQRDPPSRQRDPPSPSRVLSKILRHTAETEGLTMRSDGFVRVADILTKCKRPPAVTIEGVVRIVKEDTKTRFGLAILDDDRLLTLDGSETNEVQLREISADDFERLSPEARRAALGRLYVRAHQGFSIATIKPERVYRQIQDAAEIPVCIHGTMMRWFPKVLREGLQRMSRTHIHFATGLPGDANVRSGIRTNSEVGIYINVAKAMEAGITFWRARNGVVLSEGQDGVIDRTYFAKAVNLKANNIPLSLTIEIAPDAAAAGGATTAAATTPYEADRCPPTQGSLLLQSHGTEDAALDEREPVDLAQITSRASDVISDSSGSV